MLSTRKTESRCRSSRISRRGRNLVLGSGRCFVCFFMLIPFVESRLVRDHRTAIPGAQTERRAASHTAPFSFRARYVLCQVNSSGSLKADLPLAVRVVLAGVFLRWAGVPDSQRAVAAARGEALAVRAEGQ